MSDDHRHSSAADSAVSAVAALLSQGLEALDLELGQRQRQQLCQLAILLGAWATRINLTGHKSPEAIAQRLILDAAALGAALPELASARGLADLGSGAGFPGLPLAILNPELEVRLVESRERRIHFQREARRQLDLHNVVPLRGRAESLPVEVPSDVVIAQAMTRPARAIELMTRWSRPDGLLVLPASEAAAPPSLDSIGLPLEVGQREYRVPLSGTRRRLWTIALRKG